MIISMNVKFREGLGLYMKIAVVNQLRSKKMKFKIYQDQAGLYRWTLVSRNGKTIADGGEGYAKRSNARRAIERLIDVIESNYEAKGYNSAFIEIVDF